jgi:hypothetical protein
MQNTIASRSEDAATGIFTKCHLHESKGDFVTAGLALAHWNHREKDTKY